MKSMLGDDRLSSKPAAVILLAALLLTVLTGSRSESFGASVAGAAPRGECVVLLHGLGRTSGSMSVMAEALAENGYTVANVDYPSRDMEIEALAADAVPRGILRCSAQEATRVHFVTHSLGGILVRYFLSRNHLEELGRVVMLSPPNRGSEIIDRYGDNWLYSRVFGPVWPQLSTSPDSLVNRLGPVSYPVGVITGSEAYFIDLWFSEIIPGEDDGKVSVERARLSGMSDFLVVPYTHPFIMREAEVVSQVLHFLRHGRFDQSVVDN